MTVSIVTLGCKTNQFESAAMQEQLKHAGYTTIPFDEGADLVLVNTCTVTANTDAQSRNLIRRARRMNPRCRVVVTGCYAQVDPEPLKQLPGVSLVIGNEEKQDFLQWLEKGQGVHVSDIRQSQTVRPLEIQHFSERSRAFVQIQNGCDAFCSYCIIPYARGRSRSVALADVVSQVQRLEDSGYNEIVLTGIHIGGYGKDLSPQSSLHDLVQTILQETSRARFRLGSVEPNEISDELLDLVFSTERICPHWHIPLQSGSDAVLQRMNRDYTASDFRGLVQRIVERNGQAAIGLDVIVGFPAETEAEFEETCALLEELPIAFLHVFPFSVRPGTPAASMTPKISSAVVKDRAARLRDIGDAKRTRFAQQFVGQTVDAIRLGGRNDDGRVLTAHYLDIRLPGQPGPEGETLSIVLDSVAADGLVGHCLGRL